MQEYVSHKSENFNLGEQNHTLKVRAVYSCLHLSYSLIGFIFIIYLAACKF